MPEEVHISSLVVHAAPARLSEVEHAIAAMPGARVHASAPNGKLVVTLDTAGADEMADRVVTIQRAPGVLCASLVYQYSDTLEAISQEVPDAG